MSDMNWKVGIEEVGSIVGLLDVNGVNESGQCMVDVHGLVLL